jgi:hypothetical protein
MASTKRAAVQRINPVDRLLTEYDLQAGDDIVVDAGKRNAVAKALEVYQDGSAMVQWHNTKKLDSFVTYRCILPIVVYPEGKTW